MIYGISSRGTRGKEEEANRAGDAARVGSRMAFQSRENLRTDYQRMRRPPVGREIVFHREGRLLWARKHERQPHVWDARSYPV